MFSASLSESLLLEEADPYSPRTLYGEESEKPVSRRSFCGENLEEKTRYYIQLRPSLHPNLPHVKRKSRESSTPLNRNFRGGTIWGFWGREEEEKGCLSGFLRVVSPYDSLPRYRRGLLYNARYIKGSVLQYARVSRCGSRITAGSRRGATGMQPGCPRVARPQKCGNRVTGRAG